MQLMEAEEYDAAEEIFTKLEKYEDSPEQIKKIHYIRAEAARINGDYETALAEYALAGEDYEDVKRKVRDVSYTYGVQLLNRGRVVDSYEVLYPIRTYYVSKSAGVDPATGKQLWLDKNDNVTSVFSEDDAVFTGKQRYAPYAAGLQLDFAWKDLSVSANFSGIFGKWTISNTR